MVISKQSQLKHQISLTYREDSVNGSAPNLVSWGSSCRHFLQSLQRFRLVLYATLKSPLLTHCRRYHTDCCSTIRLLCMNSACAPSCNEACPKLWSLLRIRRLRITLFIRPVRQTNGFYSVFERLAFITVLQAQSFLSPYTAGLHGQELSCASTT